LNQISEGKSLAATKIKLRTELISVVEELKENGEKIVFTNGCFDILHVGHIQSFREAKRNGDILIVAINSDNSVRSIKGQNRPIIPEGQRAEMLTAITDVDYVILFDEPDPLTLIVAIKPHLLVKGADWVSGTVIGQEVVESEGGKVLQVPLVKGVSTSDLIKRIKALK